MSWDCAVMVAWARQPGFMPDKTTGSEARHTHSSLLIATAAFATIWAAARASIQSITIDEADTYLYYVGTPEASHWKSAANNHVLNSMLMRLSSSLFGVSNLTLRLPALLGAIDRKSTCLNSSHANISYA